MINLSEFLTVLKYMRNQKIYENRYHLEIAGKWLLKAQEKGGKGGYSHSYSLFMGWAPAYPETTGYIIPTLLNLGEYLNNKEFINSSLKAGEWLLSIQQEDGSFLDLSGKKQIFDTGQIIEGLLKLYIKTGNAQYLIATQRSADWIIQHQELDGFWVKFSYNNLPHTYYSKVSGNLLKLYNLTGEKKYKTPAERNLKWCLNQQQSNGYFNFMSFTNKKLPYLHNIIYVLEGLLESYKILKEEEMFRCLKRTVNELIQINKERDFILYSQYDENWQYLRKEKCLVGLAQWASLLLDLYNLTSEPEYLKQGVKTIYYLKSKQILTGSDNILGNLPGSIPIYGSYFRFSFNNWTAKYFIDALLQLELNKIPLWKEQEIFVSESFCFNRDRFYQPNRVDLNKDYLRIIENVIRNHPDGSTFLDIGCGRGHYIRYLQTQYQNIHFIGVDPTFFPKEKNKNISTIQIYKGSIYHLPFEENSCDVILIKEVLQHIAFMDLALKEVFRVAKDGSQIIIIDRNPISILGLCKWIFEFTNRWMYPWDSPFREKWYSKRKWKKMLTYLGSIEDFFIVNMPSKRKIFFNLENRFFVFIVRVKK